jgi:hypothetical protein
MTTDKRELLAVLDQLLAAMRNSIIQHDRLIEALKENLRVRREAAALGIAVEASPPTPGANDAPLH